MADQRKDLFPRSLSLNLTFPCRDHTERAVACGEVLWRPRMSGRRTQSGGVKDGFLAVPFFFGAGLPLFERVFFRFL